MAPTISTTQLSYTLSGLVAPTPHRLDGRSMLAYRPLHLTTGIAPSAAGSAQCVLAGSTRCTAVVSAEVVEESEAAASPGRLLDASVECAPSIPQTTSLAALLVTLQKALTNALAGMGASSSSSSSSSTTSSSSSLAPSFSQEQLVILRSISAPHSPTRAWKLHVDVEFTDVGGGNLADAMFATVYAALGDVRLPQTRAVGVDIETLLAGRVAGANDGGGGTGSKKGMLDIFDTKRRTPAAGGAAASQVRDKADAAAAAAAAAGGTSPSSATTSRDQERIGVDFEIDDLWGGGVPLAGASSFPVGITMNMLPNGTLLDATLTEESCLPASRRLLVVYSPVSGHVAGTYTLGATLNVGSSRTGEADADGSSSSTFFYGTTSYDTISAAIRQGHTHAQGLHAAIHAQVGATAA